MFTIYRELPDWEPDYLRQLQMLVLARANRKQLGPHFDHVAALDAAEGSPAGLIFHFVGSNRHGAEQDTAAFMRDLMTEVVQRHDLSWPPAFT
jgi:hypothetical protein